MAAGNLISATEIFRFKVTKSLPPNQAKIMVIYDRFGFFTKLFQFENLISSSLDEINQLQTRHKRRFFNFSAEIKIQLDKWAAGYSLTDIKYISPMTNLPPEATIIIQRNDEVLVWKVSIPVLKIPHMYDKMENMKATVEEFRAGRPSSWSGDWNLSDKLYLQLRSSKKDLAYQLLLSLDKNVNFYQSSSMDLKSDHIGDIHCYSLSKLYFYNLS